MNLKFWKKNTEEQSKKPAKTVRIEAEDLIEQGYSCSEIAEELGIDVNSVYRIKEAKKRRDARIQNQDSDTDTVNDGVNRLDPIKEMNIEIKKLELEQKKRELVWALEDKQRERQELMFGGDDYDDEEPESIEEYIIKLLAPHLVPAVAPKIQQMIQNKLQGGQQTLTPHINTSESSGDVKVHMPETAPLELANSENVDDGILTPDQVDQAAEAIKSKVPKKYLKMISGLKNGDLLKIKQRLESEA